MNRVVHAFVAVVLVGCIAPGSRDMTEEADPRRKLLAEIGDINDFSRARSLVSLESFFLGNDDYGSIGYNFYPDQPSPSEFFELLTRIRGYSAVRDVLVQVQQHEDPDAWPSTDTIWIVTDASVEEVAGWLGDRFRADELFEGIPDGVQTIDVPAGCQAIGVWYD